MNCMHISYHGRGMNGGLDQLGLFETGVAYVFSKAAYATPPLLCKINKRGGGGGMGGR